MSPFMETSREAPSWLLELCDIDEAVETQRDSSGHAPMAGVGKVSGDGESHRAGGLCCWSLAVAMG